MASVANSTRPEAAVLESTSLGYAMVVLSARGVCALQLADHQGVLRDYARDAFGTEIAKARAGSFDGWIQAALSVIESPLDAESPPLDLVGTSFQIQVWECLRMIPAGETRTYADVARAIHRPTATRAVAQACGANRIAVLVPCHRVIRSDGSLGGYSSGVHRKRLLLAREGVEF